VTADRDTDCPVTPGNDPCRTSFDEEVHPAS